jgi:hypothetical protein
MHILTEKWLKDRNACKEGIQFVIRNKLIGFPLDMLPQVKGEFNNFVAWLQSHQCDILEFDSNQRVIYKYSSTGSRYWYTYGENGLLIKIKTSYDHEYINQYDDNNNCIRTTCTTLSTDEFMHTHYEYDSNNSLTCKYALVKHKIFYEYDSNNNLIHKWKSSGDDEYWYEYDILGNVIYQKYKYYPDSEPHQEWHSYDDHNNLLTSRSIYTQFANNTIEYYDDGQLKKYNKLIVPYFEK